MRQNTIIFLSTSLLVLLLAFQNCGPKPQTSVPFRTNEVNQAAAIGYLPLTSAEAQALVMPFEGQCANGYAQINTYPLLPINAAVTGSVSSTFKATALADINGDSSSGTLTIYNSELVSNPFISQVSDYNGKIHICGIDVGVVQPTVNAFIVIENAEITNANQAQGTIVVINGNFPNSSFGYRGKIAIKNKLGVYEGREYF